MYDERSTASMAVMAATVTPNDSGSLATGNNPYADRLYVGTGGNVRVLTAGSDTAVTYVGVTAGSYLCVKCRRVYSTSTTASDIVAEYCQPVKSS